MRKDEPMKHEYPLCRYIAVYEDHWEVREGTELDMGRIVDECCDDGFVNEKGTTVPGVWMLWQDGLIDRDESNPKEFVNQYSAAFSVYGEAVSMNFVLVGFDDYSDEEEEALQKMSNEEMQRFFEEHPLDYRSLSDDEIEKCIRLLESVSARGKAVFLGGSQTCTSLPEEVRSRLSCRMKGGVSFLIGDCKGADQLMQKYLHEKGYEDVTVYVSGDEVRHNEGAWKVIHCASSARPNSYEFYSAKDIRMAEAANEAFMLWDGESHGTRENIIRMRQLGKAVTVYREQGGWCWEEKYTDAYTTISDEGLSSELKRYSGEENSGIHAAVSRCPKAEKELYLKRDEVFMLHRIIPNGQLDPASPVWQPFLSFTDVLAVIRDELVTGDPSLPKPKYTLEKWASKGDFNLTFFRFKDKLIEVEPPDEDFHMEQTARFELEGDEVVSFRQIDTKKKSGKKEAL